MNKTLGVLLVIAGGIFATKNAIEYSINNIPLWPRPIVRTAIAPSGELSNEIMKRIERDLMGLGYYGIEHFECRNNGYSVGCENSQGYHVYANNGSVDVVANQITLLPSGDSYIPLNYFKLIHIVKSAMGDGAAVGDLYYSSWEDDNPPG